MQTSLNEIWTIGHSTRSIDEFISMLQSFRIALLVDVRHFPGSGKYPQFNKEQLQQTLQMSDIEYRHIIELGGRRKPDKNSKNSVWRNQAFRGYADYMETPEFHNGINMLSRCAELSRTAYMCSEAVWWRCHRSMISDYLKADGWNVLHIMGINKAEEHPFTAPARINDGKLSYG